VRFFAFFSKTERVICANFFQGLGENTCSLQPALKINAPDLERRTALSQFYIKNLTLDE